MVIGKCRKHVGRCFRNYTISFQSLREICELGHPWRVCGAKCTNLEDDVAHNIDGVWEGRVLVCEQNVHKLDGATRKPPARRRAWVGSSDTAPSAARIAAAKSTANHTGAQRDRERQGGADAQRQRQRQRATGSDRKVHEDNNTKARARPDWDRFPVVVHIARFWGQNEINQRWALVCTAHAIAAAFSCTRSATVK